MIIVNPKSNAQTLSLKFEKSRCVANNAVGPVSPIPKPSLVKLKISSGIVGLISEFSLVIAIEVERIAI